MILVGKFTYQLVGEKTLDRVYFLQLFEGDIFCKNDPRRDPFIFKKHAECIHAPNSYTRTALHPGKIAQNKGKRGGNKSIILFPRLNQRLFAFLYPEEYSEPSSCYVHT